MHSWGLYLVAITVLFLSGCAASVKESHYFATYPGDAVGLSKPVNFFRLRVKGNAQFSSARYLAGFYDERAVDLFFNEIRTKDSNKSTLFKSDLKEPGSNEIIKPLSPVTEDGAFVLIMSTDADSVANAIGSFAESEIVANAITNLIAREKIREKVGSDAAIIVAGNRGGALVSQLEILLTEAATQTTAKGSEKSYLRVLNSLARALGHDHSFSSFADARQWFQLELAAKGD